MVRADMQYALDWPMPAKMLDLLQERADTEIMVTRECEFLHIVPIFIGLRAGSLMQKLASTLVCRRDNPRLRFIMGERLRQQQSFPSTVTNP